MGAGELEGADRLAPGDHVTDADPGGDRLVGGASGAVVDDDHATTRERGRECDPPGQRRVHDLAERAGEVHPAMTSTPRGVRWVERLHHSRRWLERPHPDRDRVHGYAVRAGRPRQGDERDQHDGNDDQRPATVGPDPVGE